MKICLLSPYDALSHRYWAQALFDMFPDFDWSVHALPARHFNWRIRGNPLAFAFGPDGPVDIDDCDLLLATSMTDLATLKGLLAPLAAIPTIVYFHENQFCYPKRAGDGLEAKMVTLYNALAADRVVFNSEFNRDGYLKGIDDMLARFPDFNPRSCVESIRKRSDVVPVPIATDNSRRATSPDTDELQIVWNHRWEYDKGPDRLAKIIDAVALAGIRFRIHVVGQQFRTQPQAFTGIRQRHRRSIGTWGYIDDRKDYLRLLARCDVVLSTALHDFQGIAVLEAVANGCVPLVPDRLAYREFIPAAYRYQSEPALVEAEISAAAQALIKYARLKSRDELPQPPSVAAFEQTALAPVYRQLFNSVVTARAADSVSVNMNTSQ